MTIFAGQKSALIYQNTCLDNIDHSYETLANSIKRAYCKTNIKKKKKKKKKIWKCNKILHFNFFYRHNIKIQTSEHVTRVPKLFSVFYVNWIHFVSVLITAFQNLENVFVYILSFWISRWFQCRPSVVVLTIRTFRSPKHYIGACIW